MVEVVAARDAADQPVLWADAQLMGYCFYTRFGSAILSTGPPQVWVSQLLVRPDCCS